MSEPETRLESGSGLHHRVLFAECDQTQVKLVAQAIARSLGVEFQSLKDSNNGKSFLEANICDLLDRLVNERKFVLQMTKNFAPTKLPNAQNAAAFLCGHPSGEDYSLLGFAKCLTDDSAFLLRALSYALQQYLRRNFPAATQSAVSDSDHAEQRGNVIRRIDHLNLLIITIHTVQGNLHARGVYQLPFPTSFLFKLILLLCKPDFPMLDQP